MNLNISKEHDDLMSFGETQPDSPLRDGITHNSVTTHGNSGWSTEVILWLIIWILLIVGFTLATCYIGKAWEDTNTVLNKPQRRRKCCKKSHQETFRIQNNQDGLEHQVEPNSRSSSGFASLTDSENVSVKNNHDVVWM